MATVQNPAPIASTGLRQWLERTLSRSGLTASRAQADRPARPRDVNDLAVLGHLDLTLGHKFGGGGAGRIHEWAEVGCGHRPGGVGRTDRLAGSAALEELKDCGPQTGLFGGDGSHWHQDRLPDLSQCER